MAPTTKKKTSAAARSYSGGSAKHKMKTTKKKVPKRHQSPETRRRNSGSSVVDPSTHVGKSFADWWIQIPTKICHLTGREKPPEEQRKYERLCFGTIKAYVDKTKNKKSCKPFYKVEYDDGDKHQLYEENFDVEEKLQLYQQYESTRNESVVARDFETKQPIEVQSVTKDDHDKNLVYTTYVRRVDGEEEEEEEDNDAEDDNNVPEGEGEEAFDGDDDAGAEEYYDAEEEGTPCCIECAAKDSRIEQLELENEEADKAHARDHTKWTATENEHKRKLDAASEHHASDQRTIAKLMKKLDEVTKERDGYKKESDGYKNERDEATKQRNDYKKKLDEYKARMKGIQRLASSSSPSSSSSEPHGRHSNNHSGQQQQQQVSP